MTAKEREVAYLHWQSMILRETRDLASLERMGAAALNDRDVARDPELSGRLRAHVAQRRAELTQEEQRQRNSTPARGPARPEQRHAAGNWHAPQANPAPQAP